MNEWYALVNDLETDAPELDELSQKRIEMAVRKSLPKGHSKWKIVLITAVIVLLTACGVAIQYADWFESLVDPAAPSESEDLLAAMGTPIQQQQTVDGVTVHLHGVLYDGETFLLSLSVEGIDSEGRYSSQVERGKSWLYYSRKEYEKNFDLEEQMFPAYDQIVETIGSYLHMTRQFDMDRCLLLLEPTFAVQEGRELTLHLEDFSVMGKTIEGPFSFTFTPIKKIVSCVYTGNVPLTSVGGSQYTLTEVALTPLEIQAVVCGTMDEQGRPPESTPTIEEVQLSTEGWAWSSKSSAWIRNSGDGLWDGILTFGTMNRVIDPAQVSAIRIDETWIDLSQLTKKS